MESRSRIPRARFEQLVREHHAAVYRSALRVLQQPADAEDATQRVFVRALEGKLDLDRAGEPRAVLRWMAVREALSLRREGDNRRRREEGHAMQRTDAADEVEVRDRERAVREQLARLPEELRLPLVLRFQEELSFQRIGEALGVSEPSAHDRVQRGLERLRDGLARAGLAGVVAIEALARDEAIAVPRGLEARLVALHKGALATLAASPLAWTALAAVAAAGLWLAKPLLAPRGDPGAGAALEALAPAAAADGARALDAPPPDASGGRRVERSALAPTAPVATAAAQAVRTGTITGRALDREGAPVANAIVFAESTQLEGKFPRYVRETKSDGAGRFTLVVPVSSDDGQEYRLGATCAGYVCRRADATLRVEAGATHADQRIELAPITGDRAGAFALAVRVEGDDGRPIEKAAVVLSRELSTSDGGTLREWEAGGLTDSTGALRLEGARLGLKHLRVDAVGQGWRASESLVGVEEQGVREHVVRLQRGLSIAGELRDVDGRRVDGVELFVSAPGTVEFRGARFEAPGLFRFVGLDPGEFVLSLGPSPVWSHVALEHVAAGREDVLITLKRADDPSDRGDHLAELHGRFVDDATGAEVRALDDALELHVVPPGTAPAELREQLGAWLEPSMAQREGGFGAEPVPASAFHVTGLPAAEYVAVARVDGYAPRIVGPLALGERAIARDVEVRLRRGARVAGRVLDPEGRPLAGAGVILCAPPPAGDARVGTCDQQIAASNGVGTLYFAHARTDDEGRFTLERVSCDIDLSLVALHPDFEPVRGAQLELADGAALDASELRFARRRVR